MNSLLLAAALVMLSAGASTAQTSTTTTTTTSDSGFYVVQDTATKRCTVPTPRPAGTPTTVIGGDGTVYKSRDEADVALKKVTTCTQ